ncbi:hydrogenobyrinic acid a,c-diamide synthase (glutamine-hydrolyzing) [Desulfofundulus thermobenzoicus]|uniref:Cobyrinate a,c-diamide synthase n=1 Tax=Desulfofundulus thermobenzoicus TaxID=29376 RepID=A0A6N7ISY9_9FIRM|nr:cobyrinate a,c-diamide synthase [Desulfofundulus thermobenzoicus]MQL52673.1 hydrogenobyrinic acid a,c-diamide synthase (glutamine-hydrolyzing) [Desulfofundulus thermobenzoicus]HHW44244.1 hydrogenobyrinic acid a,c-diamide synthase (glutamine-hydrolyzing) [Desulfotomaculum sp.]
MLNNNSTIPRLVIGAPRGRSGKTTVTIGLLTALVHHRQLTVQPFKKGPDFIDPSWLTLVTGRPCRNLDGFLMSRETIRASFIHHSMDAHMAVVEGAMGLFDGVDIEGSGSTAEIARTLKAPVILVVDTTRMTRSVAPLVKGFMEFDPDVTIAGVILNKVARARHERMLRQALERYCGIPVLGVIPKDRNMTIPDRHLGLIPAGERDDLQHALRELARAAVECLDLDGILAVARNVPPLEERHERGRMPANGRDSGPLIGVFRDRAFSFYYPENLEALQEAGARLIYIDALSDNSLPPVDALYIGGGFPEVFAPRLEANAGLRESVRLAIEKGLPVYAECGGLMYLGRRITWQERSYEMCGALPFDVLMEERPRGHGYEVVQVVEENPFFPCGMIIRGHEFHHSRLTNVDGGLGYAFRVMRGNGIDGQSDGLVYKNVLAAYNHIHALSCPDWARSVVARAEKYRHGTPG